MLYRGYLDNSVAPSQDPGSIELPGEVIAAGEDGKLFCFTPREDKFLVALSESHDIAQASDKVGKDVAWARRFFAKPKTREWISLKSVQHAAKSGTTQEWWYWWGRSALSKRWLWWEGECASCHFQVKTYLEPVNEKTMGCYLCSSAVLMTRKETVIKPTREDIEIWKEFGGRAVPKIERIQHEFNDTTFQFTARNAKEQQDNED